MINFKHNDKFQEWRRRNPGKQFKDFYAEQAQRSLRKRKTHRTLGGNLLKGEFGSSGKDFFSKLVDLGLKPNDTCIDYGCGTLRIGIHAINYLKPGAYWGMDTSEFLLGEGRKLIGDRLWAEKQPNLRVISTESVAEVAAAKPVLLFSNRVLFHVHPDELSEYFRNIINIIGRSGKAIITGKWSHQETIRLNQHAWAHGISIVQELVENEGGSMAIITEQKGRLEQVNVYKSGILRIVDARHYKAD
jgi:hypothetical protein